MIEPEFEATVEFTELNPSDPKIALENPWNIFPHYIGNARPKHCVTGSLAPAFVFKTCSNREGLKTRTTFTPLDKLLLTFLTTIKKDRL